MDAVKSSRLQPPRNHRRAQAMVEQLPSANDPALALGKPANAVCVGFRPTVGRNSTQNGHDRHPGRRDVPDASCPPPFIADVVPRDAPGSTAARTRLEDVSDEAHTDPGRGARRRAGHRGRRARRHRCRGARAPFRGALSGRQVRRPGAALGRLACDRVRRGARRRGRSDDRPDARCDRRRPGGHPAGHAAAHARLPGRLRGRADRPRQPRDRVALAGAGNGGGGLPQPARRDRRRRAPAPRQGTWRRRPRRAVLRSRPRVSRHG